ncbi:tetratricopeptide repeat protein [Streptomyces sp. NPDC006879]|uniref:tetratricopeptide repeat protein n=1 Tax=Streptomyces sp. NPDC006879 TaxID=3364767 RepID=UPI00367BABD3
MDRGRLVAVNGSGGAGSGYEVGPGLVLTSAHVVSTVGAGVEVFRPGGVGSFEGAVVWCGSPGARDDAALVHVGDGAWRPLSGAVTRWGRLVTDRPGLACETWGVPELFQRPGAAVEAAQLEGRMNPGSGFVGNQYVLDLSAQPPRWPCAASSPWGGLSGAAVFSGSLLVGVVAADRQHSRHASLSVVPSYVLHHDPLFRDALSAYGAGRPSLEAVEFQHLADAGGAPVAAGAPRSPAALLQPGRATVPFQGREALLKQLGTWCEGGGFEALLIHGPGGQGKTRLAHRFGELRAGEGWTVVWPRADVPPGELAELRHAARPLMVVVDYAETRTGQLAGILEAARAHCGDTAFRVLLLARTAGDWWARATTMTSAAEDFLEGAPVVALAPLEPCPAGRPDAYRRAVHAFAAALGQVRGLGARNWPTAASALPVRRLDRDGLDNALTLHMTALADLLDVELPAEPAPAGPPDGAAQGVEDRLLGHEGRYWDRTAATQGLTAGLDRHTLEDALAAAFLVGATTREQADATWLALPSLADQPRDHRDRVTRWIAGLYPAPGPHLSWGVLQPDRLAERLVGRRLDADGALAERLISGLDGARAAHLLTVYSRAAAHPVFDDRLDTQLTALCRRHHKSLTAQLIATATQAEHPGPLIRALTQVSDDPTTSLADLQQLNDHLPPTSHRLAAWAADLARLLSERYRSLSSFSRPRAELARCLNTLSIRLGDLGRQREALAAVEEAVVIWRALADARPDPHLVDLAGALNNMSVDLGDLGRRQEARAAIEEAVSLYRSLALTDPARLPALAAALSNLSVTLGGQHLLQEALSAVEESVRIRRTLAAAQPDVHLPELAGALNNLAVRLGALGRREAALSIVREAVDLRRELARAHPDAHLHELAGALNNLAVDLGSTGRHEESLTAFGEAIEVYRGLAGDGPDAHSSGLAMSLHNFSIALRDLGRRTDALAAVEEAVALRRALAGSESESHLRDLATSLDNFATELNALGRAEEALVAAEESLDIRRALAGAGNNSLLPALAAAFIDEEAVT